MFNQNQASLVKQQRPFLLLRNGWVVWTIMRNFSLCLQSRDDRHRNHNNQLGEFKKYIYPWCPHYQLRPDDPRLCHMWGTQTWIKQQPHKFSTAKVSPSLNVNPQPRWIELARTLLSPAAGSDTTCDDLWYLNPARITATYWQLVDIQRGELGLQTSPRHYHWTQSWMIHFCWLLWSSHGKDMKCK